MELLKNSTLLLCLFAVILSCRTKESTEPPKEAMPENQSQVVEVSAVYNSDTNRHLFQTDTDTIPSGWTTIKFTNASPMVHFMVFEKMPGNRTSEDSQKEVFPAFQEAIDLINTGKVEDGLAKLGELPDWFSEVVFMGGPGLLSPGGTSETTVKLAPGNYVLECYVKTSDGQFHSALGMFEDLRVTKDSSDVAPPESPDIEINLSNEGFDVQGTPTPGNQLVAVHFNEENPPLLGNDVHLAQLTDTTNIDSVAAWMDWSQPKGLVSSAEKPARAHFLGGTHEMPQGNTAYFNVMLTPGRYAWISERSAQQAMYKEFTVEDTTQN